MESRDLNKLNKGGIKEHPEHQTTYWDKGGKTRGEKV